MTRTSHPIHRRWLALVAAMVLVVAACGGDSDDEGATTTTADGGSATTTTPDSGTGGDSSGGETGEQYATVTLEGETYEADLTAGFAICAAIGGAVGGAGPIIGFEDGTIDITVPPEDWETSGEGWDAPDIRLDLGEDAEGVPIDWRAGGEVVGQTEGLEGKSQVDSFTNDGTTASGSATFIDYFQWQLFQTGQVDEPQPVQGSFEVSCG